MKRKSLSVAVIIAMLFSVFIPLTVSASSVSVRIDNIPVSFSESTGYPFIDAANRTQVPLRCTMESYGCEVQWNGTSRTAVVQKNGITVQVPVGKTYILINGKTLAIDTAAVIRNNRTYLPIRAVLEAFGAGVTWNSSEQCVMISSKGPDSGSGNAGTGGSGSGNTDTDIGIEKTYIGNKNSKVFHVSSCPSVARMKDSNKVALSSRAAAISAGYTPCKNCNP